VQDRKVLLQAHQLMTRRASLALLCGEPDSPNQPLRRMNTATVTSIMIGVIAAVVFGVLGLLVPAPASGLAKAGTLVLDKDTATPYVPCDGGKLCPALNYASALLALDSPSVNTVTVHQSSLAGYQIGPTIGIAGLPQDLPTAGNLVQGPWSVCTEAGGTVLVGGASTEGAAVDPAHAVLVQAQGSDWVLWNGDRLAIVSQVMQVVFHDDQPVTVPAGWLDALPRGPDFAPPTIPGSGQMTTDADGKEFQVGQVVDVPQVGQATGQASSAQGDFVVEEGGKLATISSTQANLLLTVPGTPVLTQISSAEATMDQSDITVSDGGLPASLPTVVSQTSTLCTVYGNGLKRSLTTGGSIPAGATPTAGSAGVNAVWLPSEHGALVGAAPSVTQPTTVTAWFLVDGGERFALPSASVAGVLGYNLQASKTVLPASVVGLLPQGPVLDPAAATTPVG
jgi:type VII secretion protein EccB